MNDGSCVVSKQDIFVCWKCELALTEIDWMGASNHLATATVVCRCKLCATHPLNTNWLKFARESNISGVAVNQ